MAQRRMFSPQIVGSDAFLDMPTSSRELYFQLGMYADDDGFINPKKIMRMVGCTEDDLKILLAKRFVLAFENGVVVLKHWRINNLIQKDRYHATIYQEQFLQLKVKENGTYTDSVNKMLPEVRLGKDREEEIRAPRNAEEISPIPDSYLSKFSRPAKVHGPIQALATEIYEATGKREKFPALCGIIKRKGVNFAREQWQDVSKSPGRDKLSLFKYRMAQTKVPLATNQ